MTSSVSQVALYPPRRPATIERRELVPESLGEHSLRLRLFPEDDVGYIHITNFNEQTTVDLQKAV